MAEAGPSKDPVLCFRSCDRSFFFFQFHVVRSAWVRHGRGHGLSPSELSLPGVGRISSGASGATLAHVVRCGVSLRAMPRPAKLLPKQPHALPRRILLAQREPRYSRMNLAAPARFSRGPLRRPVLYLLFHNGRKNLGDVGDPAWNRTFHLPGDRRALHNIIPPDFIHPFLMTAPNPSDTLSKCIFPGASLLQAQ